MKFSGYCKNNIIRLIHKNSFGYFYMVKFVYKCETIQELIYSSINGVCFIFLTVIFLRKTHLKNSISGAYLTEYFKDSSRSEAKITVYRNFMVRLITIHVIWNTGRGGHFAILFRLDPLNTTFQKLPSIVWKVLIFFRDNPYLI